MPKTGENTLKLPKGGKNPLKCQKRGKTHLSIAFEGFCVITPDGIMNKDHMRYTKYHNDSKIIENNKKLK